MTPMRSRHRSRRNRPCPTSCPAISRPRAALLRLFTAGAVAAATAVLSSPSAHAQSTNWIAPAGTADWETADNWSNGIPDSVTEVAAFSRSAGTYTTTLSSAYSINGLSFSGFGTTYILNASGSGSLTLNGGGFALTVGTGATAIINAPIILAASTTFLPSFGTQLTISAAISGNRSLFNGANGTITLTGDNTYTGPTIIGAGAIAIGDGGTSGSLMSNVMVQSGTALQFNRSDASTYDRVISGGGSVTKAGAGALTLSGANTGTGTFTITGGSVVLGDASALQSFTVVNNTDNGINLNGQAAVTLASLAGSGSLNLGSTALTVGGNNASTTYAGAISGVGSLTKSGSGTLTLTGNNTYTRGTTVNAGTLSIGNGGTSGSLTGNVSVASGAALQFNRSDASTYGGVISGNGISVSKAGAGALTLTGANTGIGTFTITGGSVVLGNANALQSFTVINNVANGIDFNGQAAVTLGQLAGSGNLNLGSTALTVGGNHESYEYSGVLSGTGSLTKVGSGTLSLSGANTYTGPTTVTEGRLRIGVGASGTIPAGDISVGQGATLELNLNGGNINTGVTYGGVISGEGRINSLSMQKIRLTGANTGTGIFTINAGSIILGNANALQSFAVVNNADNSSYYVADGIDFNGQAAATLGSLAGSGKLALGATALTVGGNNATTEYSGALSGSGSLIKIGTGTMTLSGANAYTGNTTVNAGALRLTGTSASTSFTVAQGATLDFGGNAPAAGVTIRADGGVTGMAGNTLAVAGEGAVLTGHGTLTGNVSVASGGKIAPGNSPGTLNIAGDFTLGAGGTYAIELAGTGAGMFDVIAATGLVSFTGGTLNITTLNGYVPSVGDFFDIVTAGSGPIAGFGNVTIDAPQGYTFAAAPGSPNVGRLTFGVPSVAVIPESGTFVLVGVGALALAGVAAWRKAGAAAAA